jgi:microcystin-dependent protein
MPQSHIDNTQSSLALTQAFVTFGVFPPHDGGAGGAFLDEIFTFAFNFVPGGMPAANGRLLPINQNLAVFSLIGTTYGGNGTTNFAIPNLGGVTMIGTGQGPGLSQEQLGVPDGTSSVTLTLPELPPDLGGTSQPFSNYQPSLPVTYMICVQGIFPSQGGTGALQDMIGEVMPFAGNFVPTDYLPADGRLLSIAQNTALFSVIGTTYGGDGVTTFALPNLRGRTIMGASTADPLGTLIGSPTVSLSDSQTPNGFGSTVQPFDNREPSLALNYLIALTGIFPSRDSGSVDPHTPYLGEVMPFAGTFVPSGWALANGQLLPINQNQALFALLGTTYGGDGITTFALPDLRDRSVIGTGTSATIGSQLGASFTTVTAAELPLPPTLSVTSIASTSKGHVFNLSSLVTIADPDNVGYQQLELWDSNGTLAGGHFVINGVFETGGFEIDVSPANVANTVFDAGTSAGTDTLWARLLQDNGTLTSWMPFTVTVPTPSLSP